MKNSNKTQKSLWLIIAAYVCVVLLVASLLLTSAAKFRAKINGQTDTKVAEFNAALLESLSKENGESDYKQAPLGSDSDLYLWDLYPGMAAREYAFVVANGTDTDTHATVDLEFSVMVRTMENVPLQYTLVCGDKEYPARLSPFPTAIVDEHAMTSDTDWHEYTFYESVDSMREAYFRVTATDLSMVALKLRVEWPITDTNVAKPTNDSSYMNEVEIINVLIKVNSAVYYDVPATPVIGDDDVVAVAAIVLQPEWIGGVMSATSTDVTYVASYDAFRLVNGQYRYDVKITNGNPLSHSGINATTCTDYTVQVQIPVSYHTQSMGPMSLIYRDELGAEHTLSPAQTTYFKQDILQSSASYGAITAVSDTDVPVYSSTGTDLQYRIYKVWSYDIPADCARLMNRRPSETDLSYTAYDVDLLTLVCANDEYAQKLITGNPTDGIDTVQRRFYILINAAFTAGEQ